MSQIIVSSFGAPPQIVDDGTPLTAANLNVAFAAIAAIAAEAVAANVLGSLPTSQAGLGAGAAWNNNGVICIVSEG